MSRSKASFKALRETLGMSQQLLAELLHVDLRSVKRWESPTATAYKAAPDDAWELLESYAEKQAWVVETALDDVAETEERHGEPDVVSLTYWTSADQFEAAHPGWGQFWQMANANSRLIAWTLRNEGYQVDFDFPGLEAIKRDGVDAWRQNYVDKNGGSA